MIGTYVAHGGHGEDHSDHLHTRIEELVKQGWPEAEEGTLALAGSIQERIERAASMLVRTLVTFHVYHSDTTTEDPRTWGKAIGEIRDCEDRACIEGLAFLEQEGFDFVGAMAIPVMPEMPN